MPATEAGASTSKRAIAGLLFLSSGMTTFDAYSTLNSSPWTSENFGADPEKAKSAMTYVKHAVVFSMSYAVVSAVLAETWVPVIGAVVANIYLVTLYKRALAKGKESGSTDWARSPNGGGG